MRNLTDSTIEVSVTRGSRARLELPAETADRLNLKDGDSIAALIGPTADHIERRVAVESWIDEGTDRDLGHDEFLAWLGSCPDQPA